MADTPDLAEILRRTVQANARLYKGWVDLSLEYFRGIADIFGGVQSTGEPTAAPTETGAGVIVLEGVEGVSGTGAFLVTNDLGRTISCHFVASDFTDATGAAVPVTVSFQPPKLDLAPGEQHVIRASVLFDDGLSPGVGYSGDFAIRGIDGFSVPVVLRRLHTATGSPIDAQEDAVPRSTPAAAATVARASGTKKTARKAGGKSARPRRRK